MAAVTTSGEYCNEGDDGKKDGARSGGYERRPRQCQRSERRLVQQPKCDDPGQQNCNDVTGEENSEARSHATSVTAGGPRPPLAQSIAAVQSAMHVDRRLGGTCSN